MTNQLSSRWTPCLPVEICDMIATYCISRRHGHIAETLKSLRLVNRVFCRSATRLLFRVVKVKSDSSSIANVEKIACSYLAPMVHKVFISFGARPIAPDDMAGCTEMLREALSTAFGRFENLQCLQLRPPFLWELEGDCTLAESVLKALKDHPSPRLESLALFLGYIAAKDRVTELLIPAMPNLQRLSLCYGPVDESESLGLCSALQHGRSLRYLYLFNNDPDFEVFPSAIHSEAPLHLLAIEGMNISLQELRALRKFAGTLTVLCLRRVNLIGGTWADFLRELKDYPFLCHFMWERCSYGSFYDHNAISAQQRIEDKLAYKDFRPRGLKHSNWRQYMYDRQAMVAWGIEDRAFTDEGCWS